MSRNTTPSTTTEDLFVLTLRVGLPVVREGKTIYYRQVMLREVDVSDERWAVRQAERLVLWQGQPRLVVSDIDHKLALTARHIEAFVCDTLRLERDVVDLELIGKLKPVDLAAIEERVFQIEVAAKVRYGEITQAQYDEMFTVRSEAPAAPQRLGPAAVDGADASADGAGPFMLADRSGQGAGGPASGLGG